MQERAQNRLAPRVLQELKRKPMVRAGDRVGVAVSGGADSVALLRLLEELSSPLGIRLTVVHFNHQLRGAGSDADESFVASLAAERRLPFLTEHQDVAGTAKQRGWNLEDAGRRLRYGYYASLLGGGNLDRMAVAHTADDQAETVLARLIRGTGPAGLAAIYPTHQIQKDLRPSRGSSEAVLIRPLLGIRRSELRSYLKELGAEWREDPSNRDTSRLRARLRHDFLPLIERDLQPAIVAHLCQLAERAREDEAFWEALVRERLGQVVCRENGRAGIRCRELLAPELLSQALPEEGRLAVARRLVRGLIEVVVGDCRQLTAGHVERALRLATLGTSGQSCDLPGVRVSRSFDWLWFEASKVASGQAEEVADATPENADAAKPTEQYSHTVELGRAGETTVVAVPEIGRRFRLKVIDWPDSRSEDTEDVVEGVLDRDLLRTPLVLRSWHAGDSFRPRGRQSSHKLKQFLRVRRVAVWDRANWPVLESGGELAWVRGLPVAAKFAPGAGTRSGVLITEEEE